MSKSLKITWDEVVELLEKEYNIHNIKLMTLSYGHEPDRDICEKPDYIEGSIDL